MNVILGAGLCGLSAAYELSRAGSPVLVIEKSGEVGGLSKTLSFGPCRFDIGGHRFYTDIEEIRTLVEDLLTDQLITVKRQSSILFNGKKVNYPLKATSALKAMGLLKGCAAFGDFVFHKLKLQGQPKDTLSRWVIANFGRTLYNAYFRDYSEKVWGLRCSEISSDWIKKRIQNLNLRELIQNMFIRKNRRTLIDSFIYPRRGIGQIAESLAGTLKESGSLTLASNIIKFKHNGRRIHSIIFISKESMAEVQVENLISTIPITTLANYLNCPSHCLRYRDLMLVVLVFDEDRLTEDTWLYVPQKDIPFGRVHEPKNWSSEMAPEGISHLVVEFFCQRNDNLWSSRDSHLINETLAHLNRLNILKGQKLVDASVVRIQNAYPIFSINYRKSLSETMAYLSRFENLIIAGRTGAFSYLNMDEAMAEGIRASRKVLEKTDASLCTGYTTLAA